MDERNGSCLCGGVVFRTSGTIRGVGSCHCSKCRKVSGTACNAQFIVPLERFAWIRGETLLTRYQLDDGWGAARCKTCGSPLPQSIDGKRMWVPAGLMDDPLDTDVQMHIFCGSRADWDRESPSAQSYEEYPPPRP
jgi:hypothetical protein